MNKIGIYAMIAIIVATSCIWQNATTASQKQLVEKGICFNRSFISPDGETVVYSKTISKDNIAVFAYDVADGSMKRLNSEESLPYLDSVARGASNRYACWLDGRNARKGHGGFDIYISDFKTGIERRLTNETSGYWNVSIRDSWVCWLENMNNPGIYVMNIDNAGTPVKIADIPRKTTTFYDLDYVNGQPVIYWEARTQKGHDLFLCNLQTMEARTVAATDKIEMSPRLHNGTIYYTECDTTSPDQYKFMNSSGRIIGHNLESGQNFVLLNFKAGGLVYPIAASNQSDKIILASARKSTTYTLDVYTRELRQISSGCRSIRPQSFDSQNFIGSFTETLGTKPVVKLFNFATNTFENLSDINKYAIQPCIARNIATWTEYNPFKDFSLDLWLYKF